MRHPFCGVGVGVGVGIVGVRRVPFAFRRPLNSIATSKNHTTSFASSSPPRHL
jgi:hypothetical protein